MNMNTLKYIQSGIETILGRKGIDEKGLPFTGGLSTQFALRPTQKEAFEAYHDFLLSPRLDDEKKAGYFEIPTGIGKTGVFIGIAHEALKAAEADKQKIRTAIVVPTTTLLYQTQQDITKFAPELERNIGLCGDGHKNLQKPITIMTYDAWVTLTEKGELSHKNVDILILDEAHRGTSENREEHLIQSYGNDTINLAFTATAHFDADKSVEKTHKNQIYYKSLPDAVKAGELAEYIHSQLYVIRVASTKYTPEQNHAVVNYERWKPQLRQQAWTQRIVQIYAHGTDHITGDPLSDNKAAFFTANTAHADRTADALNATPLLQEKAKAKNIKGVAVAIHSKMSRSEQNRRLEAVKAGEYLCMVGDEKFKEGFDHPPLKVICDYPRSSVVEKAQIAGRAARKWYNTDKGRYEGMTFIDTIVYIGDDDKQEDILERQYALYNAVLISSIIDGTEVISKDSIKLENRKTARHSNIITAIPNFDNVEEYSSLEDIKTIHAEINAIKEKIQRTGFIKITDEMHALLENEIARTGIGGKKIIKSMGDDVPEGFTLGTFVGWYKRTSQSADPLHWHALITAYKTLPTVKQKMPLTDEHIALLENEIARTGKGQKAVLTLIGNNTSKGLTDAIVNSWRKKLVKTADPDHWNALITAYEQLPTLTQKERIPLTDYLRAQLKAEMVRTNVGFTHIIKSMGDTAPEGLTVDVIRKWDKADVLTVDSNHWEKVIAAYKILPSVEIVEKAKFTDAHHILLTTEMTRTGKGAKAILALMGDTVPEGLTKRIIENWRNGDTATFKPEYWNAIIAAYKSLPAIETQEKITLTEEHCALLAAEITRTGKGRKAIITYMGNNTPKGLTEGMIDTWHKGLVKTASSDHWNGLMAAYKTLPTKENKEKIILTDNHRAQLEAEITRTGKGSAAILKLKEGHIPERIEQSMIENWRTGNSKSAEPDHWNKLMDAYKTLPTVKKKIKLTDEHRAELEAEITRTGMGAKAIIASMGDRAPESLTESNIVSWRKGEVTTANPDNWQATMSAYASHIKLSAEQIQHYEAVALYSGLSPADALDKAGKTLLNTKLLNGRMLDQVFKGEACITKTDLARIDEAYAALATPSYKIH